MNNIKKDEKSYTPREMDKITDSVKKFESDLSKLINSSGIDNLAGVPDYILAEYFMHCFYNFGRTLQQMRDHKG